MSREAGKLKPYAFSFAASRDNQIHLKGLLVKHHKLYLYLHTSSTFPTLLDGNIEYYILFENRIFDTKKSCRKK